MRTLHTEGLTLEPQLAAHADEMFVLLSDPAIYEFENQPPPSVEALRTRYARLETRCSADGRQAWLNWVIRLPSSALAGYVQATVFPSGDACIAYELHSRHWGRGLARQAVQAMAAELAAAYGVHRLVAVLKQANHRSLRLLEKLGFRPGPAEWHARYDVGADERLMWREALAAAGRQRLPEV